MFDVIFVFMLAVYGISNILVYAEGPFRIFEKYRSFMHRLPSNIGDGAECMICTPTQVGIVLSLMDIFSKGVLFTPGNIIFGADHWFFAILIDGAFASGTTWIIHTFQESLEYAEEEETDDGEHRGLLTD